MSYGPEFAEIYDVVYTSRGKDYRTESRQVAEAIRARRPGAASLLDVGCGTGEHLALMAGTFGRVEGLEVSEAMLAVARAKLPDVEFHRADMRTFDLGRRYDAITCLFAAIAHQRSVADLEATLERFAHHLEPGGVLVFDPWWFPERYIDGYVAGDVIEAGDGRTLARLSHSRREGDRSRMEVHYVIAGADTGIHHFAETYYHNLFPRELYEKALAAAGFEFEFLDGLMYGRGLFAATLTEAGR